jgi:signal transduction histidine kinase
VTLDSFLTLSAQAVFLALASLTLVAYLRRRDRARLDVALAFNVIALTILLQRLSPFAGAAAPLLSLLSQIALISQPYLLLRLVEHFRPVPAYIRVIAVLGLILSSALVAVFRSELSVAANLGIVAYFAYIDGYAAFAFVHGALHGAGVTRRRLVLAAGGSLLFALAIVLIGVFGVLRTRLELIAPLVLSLLFLAGIAYYLAFATPRWLRRSWQLSELYRFLHATTGRPALDRAAETLSHLEQTALQAVGGLAAAAARWVAAEQRFLLRAPEQESWPDAGAFGSDGEIGRAWSTRTPLLVPARSGLGKSVAQKAATLGAEAVMVVPIATAEQAWGLLLVFLRRAPLFAADDLELLGLLCAQSASALDYAEMVDEQAKLIGELRKRTAELEATNQELESFSYSVSHDLRSPLRSIDGFSLALLEDCAPQLDAKGREHLDRVRAASQRMARLIDALLGLSRITRTEMRPQTVDLSDLARSVAGQLSAAEPERRVVWDVTPGLLAEGDERLLRIALENLLENAWKFSARQPEARIAFGLSKDGGTPVYAIRDNGTGFDMAFADKLFGAFQRLHAFDEFPGTGIGLATVQRIIHRHGGRVWAESAEGEGATFYFTLSGDSREGTWTGD